MSSLNTNTGFNLCVGKVSSDLADNPIRGDFREGQRSAEQLIKDIANGYDVRFINSDIDRELYSGMSSREAEAHVNPKVEPDDLHGDYKFIQPLARNKGEVSEKESEYIFISKTEIGMESAAKIDANDTQGFNTDYDLKNLVNMYPTNLKFEGTKNPDDNAIEPLNFRNTSASQSTLSNFTLKESNDVSLQTESTKANGLNRYGGLVASTLATILGAILVIVAKTHGHEGAEIEGADDMTPTEPDYNTIAKESADQAEQAFTDKWQDPNMWGPGMVNADGTNKVTGEQNPYYSLDFDENGEYFYNDVLTPEGGRTLNEVREQASEAAVSQARADYDKALEEAAEHNSTLPENQSINSSNGKDHQAMLGIGATLIGVSGLATALIAGNKLTNHSHAKQQAMGQPIEHGPTKNFVEQHLFRVRA